MIKGMLSKRTSSLGNPLSLISCASLLVSAVSIVNAQSQNATDVVQFIEGRTSYESNRIRQGSAFKIGLMFYIVSTYGSGNSPVINSSQPFDPNLIPTKVELVNLSELDGLTFGAPNYPKGKKVRRKFSKEPLSAYWTHTRILIDGRVAANMPIGSYKLKAKLTYQPCDDSGCGAPVSRIVIIPIEVVDPKAEVQWDEYYFRRINKRDLLLVPWRLVTGKWILSHKG